MVIVEHIILALLFVIEFTVPDASTITVSERKGQAEWLRKRAAQASAKVEHRPYAFVFDAPLSALCLRLMLLSSVSIGSFCCFPLSLSSRACLQRLLLASLHVLLFLPFSILPQIPLPSFHYCPPSLQHIESRPLKIG